MDINNDKRVNELFEGVKQSNK